MKPVVECVPNFSEGRDKEVVDEIVASIKSVPGVIVLDFSSDPSHNRSVITFAGEPDAVEEAAFRSVKRASQLIDMEKHTGEHPRIGAADVVPFVPIQGVTMDQCVEMARRVGKRIGDELEIPVYLYARAATRPDRVRLPDVRKGEYEGLKIAIVNDPSRQPDFGPWKLHPTAGATAVGARPPLIAFNVNLNTPDIRIAREIARKVRESSGGLPAVQAKGVFIAELGVAQVTMNLLDYTVTPVHVVFNAVIEEARRLGAGLRDLELDYLAGIRNSEIIGLCPLDALLDVARHTIKLTDFSRNRILDLAILEAFQTGRAPSLGPAAAGARGPGTLGSRPGDPEVQGEGRASHEGSPEPDLNRFVRDLRAPTGAPGGGAASALAGTLGCALLQMVAGLTLSIARFTEGRDRLAVILGRASKLEEAFRDLVASDTRAYRRVEEAMRLPKNTPEEKAARREAMQEAFKEATRVPLEVAAKAVEALELVPDLLRYGNPNALTDVAVGTTFLETAFRGARMNAEINLASIKDEDFVRSCREALAALEETVKRALDVLRGHLSAAGLST